MAGASQNTMTMTLQTKPRRRHQWRKRNPNSTPIPHPNHLLTLTLALLSNPQNPSSKTLIQKYTSKILKTLNPNSFSSLNYILSLLPSLLLSHSDNVVINGAKIIGRLALVSIELNECVNGDDDILRVLILKVVGPINRDVKIALCNTLLDLSTTSFGRRRLIELSAVQYLMLGFLKVQGSLASSIHVNAADENGDRYLSVDLYEYKLPLLLLEVIVTLTNFCNSEQLKEIPRLLRETFLTCLKDVWSKVHELVSTSQLMKSSKGGCPYRCRLTPYNLAESVFRISLDASITASHIPAEIIVTPIFGPSQSSFMNLISEYWELTPFHMRALPESSDLSHDIFGSFMSSLIREGTMAISSTLQGLVSCPPFALNEIDIMSFLTDLVTPLGCPVTYLQDIRVVRTDLQTRNEEHYFKDCPSSGVETARSLSSDDFLKCEEAFREGYTLALRGIGFRFKCIADIAQTLASFFGQPSVGANLYVTPPNSQGLACHFDDHCVFVCQLHGTKKWSISPEPTVVLPRLYEQIEVPHDLMMKTKQILLQEGDALYIPRGFAHEAHTVTNLGASGDVCNSSVHLTLAIEVEPPFEWEGFAHVALYQWSRQIKFEKFSPGSTGSLQMTLVTLLHAAIRLISFPEPLLRKACLVAASSLPSETEVLLDKNQRTIFNQLINKIYMLSSFKESLDLVNLAIKRNEDPFHWLRWLGHLNEGKEFAQDIWDFTSDQFSEILSFIYEHKDKAEAEFVSLKSKFCSEVLYDDAKESFKILHYLYKDARMQYMNGMLALHCQP